MKWMNRCPCVFVNGLQCSALLVNQTAPKCVSDHIRLQNHTVHQHLRIFTHFRCTSILQWFSSKGSLLLHCCSVQFDYLLDIMHGLEIKGVFTQPTDFNKRNLIGIVQHYTTLTVRCKHFVTVNNVQVSAWTWQAKNIFPNDHKNGRSKVISLKYGKQFPNFNACVTSSSPLKSCIMVIIFPGVM